MLDSVFDKDGEYRRKFKEFEDIFDNSLTSMDSQSDLLKMDNETFFKIFHESQSSRINEDQNISDLFKTHEALQGLEMPLYVDNTAVVGHQLPQQEISSVKSAAAMHCFTLNLKVLAKQILQVQERGHLTEAGLQYLIDIIEPEHRLIVLA